MRISAGRSPKVKVCLLALTCNSMPEDDPFVVAGFDEMLVIRLVLPLEADDMAMEVSIGR